MSVAHAITDDRSSRRAGAARATISVVIPTLNEAANLPHVLTRLPASVDEVVLVDGHSTDDTIKVARAIRPDVRVVLQDGRGKGNALACGFAAAAGDIIVMLDGDASTDPAEIPRFVEVLLAGNDFAKGSRFAPGGSSADITGVRRLGNRALLALVNLLFGTRYSDLCYGYNAFWRDCLAHMQVTCDGFEVETLINVRVARAGLRVAEVPSVEHERLFGESKLHAVRDGLRVLRTIVTERFRRADRQSRSMAFGVSRTLGRPGRRIAAGAVARPRPARCAPGRRPGAADQRVLAEHADADEAPASAGRAGWRHRPAARHHRRASRQLRQRAEKRSFGDDGMAERSDDGLERFGP
jgi:Glycosyl transferase family 2